MAYDSWGTSWNGAWGVSWVHSATTVIVDTHDGADNRRRHREDARMADKAHLRGILESFFMQAPPEYVASIAQEAKGYVDERDVAWEPLLADIGTVTRLLDLRDDWMDEEDFLILH